MIDHTVSWEVARVGGMVAYVLVAASVVIGLLVSLKLRSPRWPRFVTTELHRFVTLLALVFSAIHGLAVWVDPFTGFSAAEVLVPFASHYRPLWIAVGIMAGYLLAAIWASEYARPRIGYAWWRRFHYLSFVAFVLATLHGIGSGSDTASPWGLEVYAIAGGAVFLMLLWRIMAGGDSAWRTLAAAATLVAAGSLAVLTAVGPAQAGWNDIANNDAGSGASAAWLASHPEARSAPTASFSANFVGDLVDEGRLLARIGGEPGGTLDVNAEEGAGSLSLSLRSGWSCSGSLTMTQSLLRATCRAGDGAEVNIEVSQLRRSADGDIHGRIGVKTGTPDG